MTNGELIKLLQNYPKEYGVKVHTINVDKVKESELREVVGILIRYDRSPSVIEIVD